MDREDYVDKRAGMDFRAKMKLFQSVDKPSRQEAVTPKTGHSEHTSDLSYEKSTASCKPTENSNRHPTFLKGNDNRSIATDTSSSRFNQTFDKESRAQVAQISSGTGREWSPNDLEVFKRPMCLISAESVENEDGEEIKINLKSESEVFEQISRIDLPMVVIAVVGLYRTGKSYLMNCLAESYRGGFALGNTIQSKTKGIWVWCKMHPTQKNTVLVLLDTEGLGDVEKGDQNHDNNVFTLATLLCNCLVYNMKGAFDNEAVSKLTFVTEIAKNIRYRGKSAEDNETLNLILPDFVLCVRDFTLDLELHGKKISANEYLESSLATKKVKAAKFNKPRECIRKYFPNRECFAFPMPGDTNIIRNLETLSFDDLCEDFREATSRFVSFIYFKPPKELLGSKPINGQMFITLVDRYVKAIKHGAVPDVDDAFTAAAKIENAKIKKDSIEVFKSQIEKIILPVSGNLLRLTYTKAQQAALEYLRKNVVHDTKAEYENQAQREMDEYWNKIKDDNDKKVQEMCKQILQEDDLKKHLDENIKNNDYETAGGYRKFQRDVDRLKEKYISVLRDFEEYEILWTWYGFVKDLKESEAKIVEADENLSKKEKEDEQKQNQEHMERLRKEHQRAQKESLEKQKKDLEDHFKKLNEDREKQFKEEQEKYEALVNEKMKKEAALKEIQRFKHEQKERKNKWFGARMWNAFWNE